MNQEETTKSIFLQEATEHLETLMLGLSNINITVADSYKTQEIFWAFFCLKGGSAMLGFDDVRKIVYNLEDCFRIVKQHSLVIDHQPIQLQFNQVYQVIEELFTYMGEKDYNQLLETGIVHKSSILLEQLKESINLLCQVSEANE